MSQDVQVRVLSAPLAAAPRHHDSPTVATNVSDPETADAVADAPTPPEPAGRALPVGPVRLILNGRAAADPALREAVKSLRKNGVDVSVRACWEEGDAGRYAAEAVTGSDSDDVEPQIIAAAGGDGTINEVVNGLLLCGEAGEGASFRSTCPSLAVLPYGTANDFATAAGLPVAVPADCLTGLPHFAARPTDVGVLNGRVFVNAASAGFAARVTTEADPAVKRLLGGLAYWWNGLKSLGQQAAQSVRVTAGDDVWEGRALAVVVANGRLVGGGVGVAPHAKIDDGQLDVTIIPEVPFSEYLAVYEDLQRMARRQRPQVISVGRGATVRIESEAAIQVNLDGEPLTDDTLEFSVLPKRVRCLLPVATPLVGDAI